MRNKKAKKIKRDVYGDFSPRVEARKYSDMSRVVKKVLKGKRVREKYRGKTVKVRVDYLVADDRRREYQDTKKQYNSLTRKERGMICG